MNGGYFFVSLENIALIRLYVIMSFFRGRMSLMILILFSRMTRSRTWTALGRTRCLTQGFTPAFQMRWRRRQWPPAIRRTARRRSDYSIAFEFREKRDSISNRKNEKRKMHFGCATVSFANNGCFGNTVVGNSMSSQMVPWVK